MRGRRVAWWILGAVAAAAGLALLVPGGRSRSDVPWRIWGRVPQAGFVPPGVVELPSGLYGTPGGDPLGGAFGMYATRTPRRPAWRCAGFVLVDLGRDGPTLLDRIRRWNSQDVATYAPSGTVLAGTPLRWREYVRTFEEREPFEGPADPSVAGAWDVVRGTAPAARIVLRGDGTVDGPPPGQRAASGLGDGIRWAARDGVLVLRVPDAASRTGVRHDTIVERDAVWSGWGDDGAEIRMRRPPP